MVASIGVKPFLVQDSHQVINSLGRGNFDEIENIWIERFDDACNTFQVFSPRKAPPKTLQRSTPYARSGENLSVERHDSQTLSGLCLPYRAHKDGRDQAGC